MWLAENSLHDLTVVQDGPSYNYMSELVNMLTTLGLIIGLIILSVWFLKKLMRSRIAHLNRSTGIKILERRALTPKSALYLVDVLGKGVVIAESQAGIQLITEFSQGENFELLLEQLQQEKDPPRRESLLQKFRKLSLKMKRSNRPLM